MKPFHASANRVLYQYVQRQGHANTRAAALTQSSEIYWACEMLAAIAIAAAYSGSREAVSIRAMAKLWLETEITPEPFIINIEEQE